MKLPRPYSIKGISLTSIIKALKNLKPNILLPDTYRNPADWSPPSELEGKERKQSFQGKKIVKSVSLQKGP